MKYSHFSKYPMSGWRWPNFSPREMASKREGELLIHEPSMDALQRLRDALGKPMLITSAYRSEAHNRAVGGARNSFHLKGMAFDVRMENQDPVEFETEARRAGFTGFGHYIKNGFMHIDTRPNEVTFKGSVYDWPETATHTPREQSIQPDKITEDKQSAAAAGAGVSTVAAVAVENLPMMTQLLGDFAPIAQTILVVGALVLVAYIIWKRTR